MTDEIPINEITVNGTDRDCVRIGTLHVYVGPMFSGKTKMLLRIYEYYHAIDPALCVLVKPKVDTRSGSYVETHDGKRVKAVVIKQMKELLRPKHQHVFIDEGQFFGGPPDETFVAAVETLLLRGQNVYVAGLVHDHLGQFFGEMFELLAIATSVDVHHAPCTRCSSPFGMYSARKTDDAEQVVIGGADKYEALCRHCFHEHRVVDGWGSFKG